MFANINAWETIKAKKEKLKSYGSGLSTSGSEVFKNPTDPLSQSQEEVSPKNNEAFDLWKLTPDAE